MRATKYQAAETELKDFFFVYLPSGVVCGAVILRSAQGEQWMLLRQWKWDLDDWTANKQLLEISIIMLQQNPQL